MKKNDLARYDLERVYWLGEYEKTVTYAKQNLSIDGVQEQLDALKAEKTSYSKKVSNLVASVRGGEEQKWKAYKGWAGKVRIFKPVFIATLIIFVLLMFLANSLPRVLGDVLAILEILSCPVSGIATAVSVLGRVVCAWQYKKYIDEIDSQLTTLGRDFTERAKSYYGVIDNLYLNSLDATQRGLVLMQREQAALNQRLLEAEKDRQKMHKELLAEQRKSRAVTEELLQIERKREAEKEAARKGWF